MIGVWSTALDGVSQERIGIGLRKLVQGGSTFEPSVPEFVAMCKSKPAAHRYYKSLPKTVNNGPASIDHYPPAVQHQLTKIGMVPKKGETHHDYCMRCKDFVMQSGTGKAIPVQS